MKLKLDAPVLRQWLAFGQYPNFAQSKEKFKLHCPALPSPTPPSTYDSGTTSGAAIETRTDTELTPLMVAAQEGRGRVVQLLIRMGAKIEVHILVLIMPMTRPYNRTM